MIPRLFAAWAEDKGISLDIYTNGPAGSSVEDGRSVRILRYGQRLPVKYYSDLAFDVLALSSGLLATVRIRSYDLIHTATPGSMGYNALAAAMLCRTPMVGAYLTDLPMYVVPRVEKFLSPVTGKALGGKIARFSRSVAWRISRRIINAAAWCLPLRAIRKVSSGVGSRPT